MSAPPDTAGRVRFPNLDGLRAIAALMVFAHHFDSTFALIRGAERARLAFLDVCGRVGVLLFFVLSGFLITYLLLEERERTGRVRIGAFYARRALRIWPLYFAVALVAFFIAPRLEWLHLPTVTEHLREHFWPKAALFAAFLPNFALAWFAPVAHAAQAWSVGVEEQFYLLWPWVLVLFAVPRRAVAAAGALYLATWFTVGYAVHRAGMGGETAGRLTQVLEWFALDALAWGGLLAVLLREDSRVTTLLMRRPVAVGVALLLVAMIALGVELPLVQVQVYSLLFGVLVLNLAANPWCSSWLELAPLRAVGRVSYGVYMWHMLCITATVHLLGHAGVASAAVHAAVSFALTLVVAGLSWRFLERPFLRLKKRFTVVAT